MYKQEKKKKSKVIGFKAYLNRSKKKTSILFPDISDSKPNNDDKIITFGNQIMLPATPRVRGF
jgi:hypothetical protein